MTIQEAQGRLEQLKELTLQAEGEELGEMEDRNSQTTLCSPMQLDSLRKHVSSETSLFLSCSLEQETFD